MNEPTRFRRTRTALLWLWAAVAVLLALLIMFLTASYFLFYNPPLASAGTADAVVVLAGASSERLPVGLELMQDGAAPVLVLSHTNAPGNIYADELCEDPDQVEHPVLCFAPGVETTRGEARSIARLAAGNGWDEIIVVTSRYHLTRAGYYIGQCSGVQVHKVASDPQLGPREWLARFAEESAALASAYVRPVCAAPLQR